MIEAIKEINFPSYATLSKATVTLNDMGDRTITTEIKIDGATTPDFSYDWEVEFKGERYIQPLRKPQALKDNQSLKSTISLTFYHWAIYQLKRDFFVELASTQAGTAFADKYVVPLAVNLEEFVVAFNKVLSYYFPDGKIYGVLNPDWEYDSERQYVDINYSYLWDILQKTHELFNVRWSIEKDNNGNYAIRFGYPGGELTHVFEYGFEGGLLKVERQVQDTNIRNKILGRGGSQNLPYLYFKDYDKYPFGGDGNQGMTPDPDAIPELSNIFFSELRDSNFRSYVQGWKTNVNRQLLAGDTLNAFDAERAKTDYAYMRGATDEKFDPVEFVKDDASIEEYGELVGKLENNEEIFPSLQGMEVEIAAPGGNTFTTRADEIVAVQEVVTDRIASDEVEVKNDIKLEAKSETSHGAGSNTFVATESTITVSSNEVVVPDGYEGTLFDIPTVKYTLEWKERIKQYMQYKQYYEGDKLNGNVYSNGDEAFPSVSYKVIDVISGKEVRPVNLPKGRYRVDYTLKFPAVTLVRGIIHAQQTPNGLGQTERVSVYWLKRIVKTSAAIICKSFNGDVILNKVDGVSISKSVSVAANAKTTISVTGDTFTVPAQGAMMVDVPISVTPAATTTYSEKTVKVVNAKTNEIVPAINIPEGKYKLLVDVTLINESSSAKVLKVELLPAYLYFVDNTEKWEPTFDVWIKNIFNTKKSDYASEAAYVEGVWSPLRTDDDMAITFSSGNLSGHDSWEFRIKKGGIAYDNSKVITDSDGNEVRSEWRLTLIKSDAELETIKKYIPYKDFNAKAGDLFFFTGIYLPHQYVLSAEKKLTQYKEDNLSEVSDIKSQWVISLDKVRAHRGDADRLVDALSVGSAITLKDKRFTKSFGEKQILQSITYEWQESALLPTIDVVLSDKVTTTLSTVAMLRGKVDELAKQVGGLSNLEQIIRKVGDLLYLRKDGFEDTSYSPTKFSDQVKFEKTVSSENFKPGAVGGTGWAAYQDENGQSIIEADKLFVRNEMQVNSLTINQIAALGGTKILSAADITITAVEPVSLADGSIGDRCFFDTKGTSKANLFMVNDIAYSNMFDSENAELKYYKRKVVEVGEDYITLSTTEGVGEGTPQEGDVIVQFGNFTNITRQSFIVIDPLNGGKIEVFSGVKSFDTKDCNKVGIGVNPSTNEAFLYGYGDMFLGDRDLKDNYIAFQKRKGDTEKKLFINAEIQIGADSSGLENLSEWSGKQQEIDNAQATANSAQSAATGAQKTADEAKELASAVEAANKALDTKISNIETGVSESVAEINARLDGVVENYYEEGAPALDKKPVTDWKTDLDKINHVGDTYTNIQEYVNDATTPDAGKSWRWCWCEDSSITDKIEVTDKDGNKRYLHWHPIADSDAVKALLEASKAQATADGKSRNFVNQPVPPYSVGDLWIQGPDGDTMRCIKTRETGSYTASDWELASKYTDDTKANEAKDAADNAQETADNAKGIAQNAKLFTDSLNNDSILTEVEKREIRRLMSEITECTGASVTEYNAKVVRSAISGNAWYLVNDKSYAEYTDSEGKKQQVSQKAWVGYYSSNMHTNSGTTVTRIGLTILKPLSLKVKFGSDAEVSYDYLNIGALDVSVNPVFTTHSLTDPKMQASTKGKQGVANAMTKTFAFDGKTSSHFIELSYRKDSEDSVGTDSGYYRLMNDSYVGIDGNEYIVEMNGSFHRYYLTLMRNGYTAEATELKTRLNALMSFLNTYGLWTSGNTTSIPTTFRASLNDYVAKYYAYAAEIGFDISMNRINDAQYLTSAMKNGKTIIDGGLVMSSMVAVADTESASDADVKAFLNGSNFAKDTTEHGKVILAGGIPASVQYEEDGETITSTDLERRSKKAATRIYEDGCTFTKKLHLEDGCYIGKIKVDNNGITAESVDDYSLTETYVSIKPGTGFISQRYKPTEDVLNPDENNYGVRIGGDCDGIAMRIGYGANSYFMGNCIPDKAALYINSEPEGVPAIKIPNGIFAGFRPKTRVITTATSTADRTLTELDHTIIINISSGTVTIKTPSAPQDGQVYEIYTCHHTMDLTLDFNGKSAYSFIEAKNKTSDTFTSDYRRHITLIYAGGQWWEDYRYLY